jgi:hypothetical protein
MIHRDIKPQNLMRTPQGRIKILDFGLARFARNPDESTGPLTGQGVVMGTADYIAPEQTRDAHRADIRSDIYSLGCTLYHLLSGRVPFPNGGTVEKMVQHAVDPPTPLAALRPGLPARLVRVVETMMAKDPARRYQTPIDVDRALAPFAPDLGTDLDFADVLPAQPAAGQSDVAADQTTEAGPDGAWVEKFRAIKVAPVEQATETQIPVNQTEQTQPRRRPNRGRRLLVAALAVLFFMCAVPVGLIYLLISRINNVAIPLTLTVAENSGRWQRAQQHIQTKQWGQAEADWAKLVGTRPTGSFRVEWSDFYAEQGRWDRAIAEQEMVVARRTEAAAGPVKDPDAFDECVDSYQRLALMHFLSGDEEGYRKSCRRMRRQFAGVNHPIAIFHIAWTCGAGPRAIDDPDQLARETEKVFQTYRTSNPHGGLLAELGLGVILYRAGRFDAAVQHLMRDKDKRTWWWPYPFLAMANQRLGHREAAKVWLRESTEKLKTMDGSLWNRRDLGRLIQREAEEVLGGKNP